MVGVLDARPLDDAFQHGERGGHAELPDSPRGGSPHLTARCAEQRHQRRRGRGVTDPLADTAGNFIRATPLVAVVSIVMFRDVAGSTRGVALAVASGALASGVGYVIWYAALRGLRATTAA